MLCPVPIVLHVLTLILTRFEPYLEDSNFNSYICFFPRVKHSFLYIKSFNNCPIMESISSYFWPLACSLHFPSVILHLHTFSNVPAENTNIHNKVHSVHFHLLCALLCNFLYNPYRFNSFFSNSCIKFLCAILPLFI